MAQLTNIRFPTDPDPAQKYSAIEEGAGIPSAVKLKNQLNASFRSATSGAVSWTGSSRWSTDMTEKLDLEGVIDV